MTDSTAQASLSSDWGAQAELANLYLDDIRYEHGADALPSGGSGVLVVRLHTTDESAGHEHNIGGDGNPRLVVRLELTLRGLPVDADPAADDDDQAAVFDAALIYRAEYTLTGQAELPPEDERQCFIRRDAIPQLWLQLRHMTDIVTSQTRTGRALLSVQPPTAAQNSETS